MTDEMHDMEENAEATSYEFVGVHHPIMSARIVATYDCSDKRLITRR
jgi:hypothetical protein